MSAVLELPKEVKENAQNQNGSNDAKPFLINVQIYHQMIEHGILTTEDKVELLDGVIIEKYTNGEKYRFTTETYDLMIKHGILTENDNVELINGEIIEKMPKGTKHTSTTRLITKFFYRNLDDSIVIQVQDPIKLNDSEPEPDLVLARYNENGYAENHPKPEDVLLLIEVSDSTLYFDRNTKGNAYSLAGIEQYLIVNVENNTIEDYRQPSQDGFQSKQTYKIGDNFRLVAFPEIEIKVADFFQNEG